MATTTTTASNTAAAPKKKLRGLGRGLDALLGADTSNALANAGTPTTLKVSQMQAGAYQPRSHMDEAALASLADSIKAQGLMQPILVRSLGTSSQGQLQYEIIAGERRWRASQLAGLTEVPVLVKDVANENAAIMALIENIQREDLNPLEEAQGIDRLIREFGLTHDAAAGAVGRSRSAVSNLLRLLNLCAPVQTMLMAGDLDMGHARALLAMDSATQVQLAHNIVQKQLSVRDAEKLVTKTLLDNSEAGRAGKTVGAGKAASSKHALHSGDIARLTERLSDALGATVSLDMSKGGKGKLVVQFKGLDVLQGILEKLGVAE
jgi:ParB family transcriptional regulator, chromosome partitioning protein